MLKLLKWTVHSSSLFFYEGGVDGPDEDERDYQSQFSIGETRFVYGELTLDYPLLKNDRIVMLEYIYFSPDETIFDTGSFKAELPAGSTSSSFTFRNGMDIFNRWEPGSYNVVLICEGQILTETTFEILDNSMDTFTDSIKINTIRLFESHKHDITALNNRVYSSTFNQFQTRAIFAEIDCSYPLLHEDKYIIFDLVIYEQDGTEFCRSQFDYDVCEGTDSSIFEIGWGYGSKGNWLSGKYRMQIFLNGIHIGDQEFEILHNNVTMLPTLTFDSLLFFDSGYMLKEHENRVYQTKFSKETARFIGWELNLEFITLQKGRKLNLEYTYLKPDQTVLANEKTQSYLERGWNSSWISRGWGYDLPGWWQTGIYTVIIMIDGKKFCEGQFEIE